jgi:hypothetical protein
MTTKPGLAASFASLAVGAGFGIAAGLLLRRVSRHG